jgi:hypothetical protein
LDWAVLYNDFVTNKLRYLISLVVSLAVLGGINAVLLWRIPNCCDFMYRYGFPLPFFVKGGFGGIRVFIWPGLIADILVLVVLAAVMSWLWHRLLGQDSMRMSHT